VRWATQGSHAEGVEDQAPTLRVTGRIVQGRR
jgi:hypothetical protein